MDESKHVPDTNRISILSAAILLAYTLAGFISLPSRSITFQLGGFFFDFLVDEKTVISLLIAGLTATGADSLVRDHPAFQAKYSIQHWLLPTLTALAIGLVLFQEPFGRIWWIFLGVGGFSLVMVLIAEYIVVDPDDIRHIPATIVLIAISFALFLILVITIRSLEARIFIMVPTITISSGLISFRTLHLLHGKWALPHALTVAIVLGQISAALNYLRLDPITYGLLLLAPAYALTSLSGGLISKRNPRQILFEPIVVLFLVLTLAVIIR